MDTKFQTSFIPKNSVVSSSNSPKVASSTNIFTLIGNVVFLVTLLVTGGLFGYKYFLKTQIQKADQAINEARADLKTEEIQELIDASARISASRRLLESHVLTSKLLALLQEITVKKVRFTEFKYTNEGSPVMSLTAEAQSYNALADQEHIFEANEFIQSPKFYDFRLNDKGSVVAHFSSGVSVDLTSYKKAIESLSMNQ